jgi:ubiquinone/menaquinone biosynthesis C-methylase UbiE
MWSEIQRSRPLTALDIGCGTGWWLERIAVTGARPEDLHGIDRSETRVHAARQRIPGADIRQGDAQELPWPDESFNLVLLMLVLSSVGDLAAVRQVLSEARRVTAPFGSVLIWEPRVPNPWNRSTQLIRLATVRESLGDKTRVRSLTLLPQLARHLGPKTTSRYQSLARIPVLRSHRLFIYERRPVAA